MTETITPITYDHPRTSVTEGRTVPEHYERMVDFMAKYRRLHGYMPSNREMVEAGFASSTSVVRYYYGEMVDYNMIQVDFGIARGIRIMPRNKWGRKGENHG